MQNNETIYRDRPRRSRYERSKRPPAMRLTERDRAVIQAVSDYGVLRRDQIERLLFPSYRTAKRALTRLYHNGYLERLRPYIQWGSGDTPALYILDAKGAQLLAPTNGEKRPKRPDPPSRYFLEHTLALNDLRIAITLAAAKQGLTLERWITEKEFRAAPDRVTVTMRDGTSISRPVIPDAACILQEPGYTSRLLLEIDRATEHNPRFVREKVRPALAYLKSEAYKQRFGFNSGRWLIVTTSETRLANMKQATEKAAGRSAAVFYFTTFDRVSPAAILNAPIWQRGGEEHPRQLLNSKA